MSARVRLFKRFRKEARAAKGKMIQDIARELVNLTFGQRVRLGLRIIFAGKL